MRTRFGLRQLFVQCRSRLARQPEARLTCFTLTLVLQLIYFMAGAIFSLPPHYQTMFASNWEEIMAQQTTHRLAGCYDTKTVVGNQFRGDQIGSQTYAMRQITARAAKVEPSDVPSSFYFVRPRPFDKTTWIDEFDHSLIGQLPDPQSPTAKQHAIAAMRQKDIVLLNALVGTRYTGAQGTVATPLPATQQIGVTFGSGGANSGLQLAKLTQASFLMDQADVPETGRYLSYAAKQLNNLITNVDQVNSALYNDVKALREGRIQDFMGYSFVRTQLTPFVSGSSTIRQCVAWQRDFLLMGMGEDMKSRIDILPQQSHAIQVRTTILMDATRKEDLGVVTVACDETV